MRLAQIREMEANNPNKGVVSPEKVKRGPKESIEARKKRLKAQRDKILAKRRAAREAELSGFK